VAHVADDSLLHHVSDNDLLFKIAGAKPHQIALDEPHADHERIPLVALAGHGHPEVVEHRGEEDDRLTTLDGAELFKDDAGLVA